MERKIGKFREIVPPANFLMLIHHMPTHHLAVSKDQIGVQTVYHCSALRLCIIWEALMLRDFVGGAAA